MPDVTPNKKISHSPFPLPNEKSPPRERQAFQIATPWTSLSASPALRIPAIQTSHTPIHHDHRRRAALAAQLRAFRIVALAERVRLLLLGFKLRALLSHQLLLVFIQPHGAQQADEREVLLDHVAQLGNDGRHEP